METTIVFAPHPDDEVLGCGGTIALKRKYNCKVLIVYMTNGENGKLEKFKPEFLGKMRQKEAILSSQKLMVSESNIFFLGFKDGKLSDDYIKALIKIKKILNYYKPQQIFIPFENDGHPDHTETNRIVINALKSVNFSFTVFEYPLWIWLQYPWIRETSIKQFVKKFIKSNISNSNFNLIKNLNTYVDISTTINKKSSALRCHESQLNRNNFSNINSLYDVGNGEFLSYFLKKQEFFHKKRSFL
ncbi:PIG-L deacetylase family protein [Spirochaeta isovalerica]|uniref:LmbE family N-acetylglucosaminyl deacetylase n=1 Tax=Spirochaeta isovalerica TaxID=150 RepID=A0A841R5Z2_9SPIO|nr:PIG-L family deacetylase [Spirochaeta isovalerica]MBB6479256.1 LmbE family N-acetylglucosaminyl deacetylase [Spirochaeta isovalerica]